MTTFVYPLAALVALAASGVAADLTPYDYVYDGRVMLIDWTMYTVQELVDEQKDEWLSKQYNATYTAVGKSMKDGKVTITEALQSLNDFYAVADTKYQNFGVSAAAKIRSNNPDVSVVNIVAPKAWCDYIFGLMYEVTKDSGSAELKSMLEAAQKKIEEAITKRIPPSEVNDLVVPLYGEGNKIYPSFSKKLTEKIEEQAEKYVEETQAAVLKKSTVPPASTGGAATSNTNTPGSTTAAPAEAAKSSARRNFVVSVGSIAAVVAATILASLC